MVNLWRGKMDLEKDNNIKYTVCKNCRGTGGRYVYASKQKKGHTQVVYEPCSICNGDGKIEDNRTRDEILDDWQYENNLWINCKDCDADGYICDDDGNEIVCQTCEGYGVVKDKLSPEEREYEKIEEEKRNFVSNLRKQNLEDDLDFYGNRKEKELIKNLENEIHSLKQSVDNTKKGDSILTDLILLAVFVMLCINYFSYKGVKEDILSLNKAIYTINKNIEYIDNRLENFTNKKMH